ncbi:hypothetical protein JXA02_05565 [candidate division KSB1 bacterium]|nr:hypothetical protein [candidate division KSB1 bacterium]RQW07925.1 MAG: hypothetical protein EH222_06385 [candidate division KSB1 bacterium]
MKKKNKSFTYLFEIGKWAILVWLLWPLLTLQAAKMSLWRVVLGVLLAVIYFGKLFYDIVLDNFKQKKERYSVVDLLMLVAFIAVVALLIGGAVLLIGLYVMKQVQEGSGG